MLTKNDEKCNFGGSFSDNWGDDVDYFEAACH